MLGDSVKTTVGTACIHFFSPFWRDYANLSMLRELERGGRNCFHMQFCVKGQEAGVEGEEEEGEVEDQEGAAVCWETYASKCLVRSE